MKIRIAKRKGVLDIEFVLSVFLFLGTVSFITILIGRESVSLQNSAITDNMKSESYQISQLLMFNEGNPKTWESAAKSDIKRIGLSSGQDYVLNEAKLAKLQQLCAGDYNFVSGMLTTFNINITVKDDGGEVLYKCMPSFETLRRPKFITERTALLNNDAVKLEVTVIG